MLIGLGYRKQSGKDTVADYLVNQYDFKKMSFAAPLKELCSYIIDSRNGKLKPNDAMLLIQQWKNKYSAGGKEYATCWDRVEWLLKTSEESKVKEYFTTEMGKHRKLYQYIGTDTFRETDPEFWIKCMAVNVASINLYKTDIVITDMRFRNEKAFVESLGHAVKVDRDLPTHDTHASEHDLDLESFNYIIDNTGTLEDLFDQASDLVISIFDKETYARA